MNLPELSRDERAALAFLMRTAARFGPDKCWPKIYSIGAAMGKSRRTASRAVTALTAFGIIERIERGPDSTRYKFLLNSEQLIGIIGAAFRKDGAAFGAALENHAKVKQITLVKPRKSRAIGAASPSLCPPTPPKEHRMSQMPAMYDHDPAAQKLWHMAQRWIALNHPDLTAVAGDKARPIMYALEAAGALDLAEDGPLPMITWPTLEAAPLVKLAEAVERKPMRLAEADIEFLRRKVEQK